MIQALDIADCFFKHLWKRWVVLRRSVNSSLVPLVQLYNQCNKYLQASRELQISWRVHIDLHRSDMWTLCIRMQSVGCRGRKHAASLVVARSFTVWHAGIMPDCMMPVLKWCGRGVIMWGWGMRLTQSHFWSFLWP